MTVDDDGRIVKIRGDRENLHSRGHICNKGLNQGAHIDNPHRLTVPLKRVGDRLVEVSWDEALDGVARGLLRVRDRHGARSLGLAMGGSGHPTAQVMLAFQLLRSMGSRNLFSPVGLELSSKYLANQKLYGCSQMEGYPDFANSRTIVLVGTNPLMSGPLHGSHLQEAGKDPARTLVVVDPRLTETGRLADRHLAIRPSTDIYFILSILQVITSESLYDQRIVRDHARGLEHVEAAVAPFTPEVAARITGVGKKEILETARTFATRGPSILFYDMGVIANRHSTLISWAVQTLMFITGNAGRKGGSLLTPTLLNFNQSEKMAFGGDIYTSRVRNVSEICGFLPVTVLQDEILTPGPGQIRAMIVSGCNPLRGYTNSSKMEKAFRELEFLVSIDPFLMEVGRMAHYVLPVCSFHEQDNISFGFHGMFAERFVQLTRKVRDPLGQSRPEWMIYRDIGKRMGVKFMDAAPIHYGFEIAEKIRSLLGRAGEIDRQEVFFRLVARAGKTSFAELEAHPHGLILSKGKPVDFFGEIRTPDKKAHLDVPEFLAEVARLDLRPPKKRPDYPFILSTSCRTLANINTLYRNEPWIQKQKMTENSLVMHPEDAASLGLRDGERARLASRVGEDEVPVSLSGDVLRGTVYLSHGWGLYSRDPGDRTGRLRGTPAALFLPDDEGDAFTWMPFYSGVPCKVEKIRARAPREKKKPAVKKASRRKPVARKAAPKAATKKAATKPAGKRAKKKAAGRKTVIKKTAPKAAEKTVVKKAARKPDQKAVTKQRKKKTG